MIKKIGILGVAFLFAMCASKKKTYTDGDGNVIEVVETTEEVVAKSNVSYRDDFRKVNVATKEAFVKKLNASNAGYSIVILTQGFKGEEVVLKNEKEVFYKGLAFSKLNNGIAGYMRVKNSSDISVTDNYSKQTAVIDATDAKAYKFIYLMKDNSNKEQVYKITYSNSLRPM